MQARTKTQTALFETLVYHAQEARRPQARVPR